jgi:hypothetical protein
LSRPPRARFAHFASRDSAQIAPRVAVTRRGTWETPSSQVLLSVKSMLSLDSSKPLHATIRDTPLGSLPLMVFTWVLHCTTGRGSPVKQVMSNANNVVAGCLRRIGNRPWLSIRERARSVPLQDDALCAVAALRGSLLHPQWFTIPGADSRG